MNDDERLMTMLLRHQAYLDRFITYETEEFTRSLPIIVREFRRIFAEIDKENLRSLTIRELRRLGDRLARAQMNVYNEHIAELISATREFMREDRAVITAIHGEVITPPRRLPRDEELWATIRREPMAATGEALTAFVGITATNSINAVNRQLQRAYADNMTVAQGLRSIIGSKLNNYRDGVFNRINNWHKAMVPTAFQHVSSMLNMLLSKRSFDDYRWIALSGACATCRERHNIIFTYEHGPRPPAHPNCRCNTVPVVTRENAEGSFSYSNWLSSQPSDIRVDLEDESPLTLRNFVAKLRRILA